MKPTVQPSTEAENGPQVVQMIPCITRNRSLCPLLEVNTLGLTVPSAARAPKIQRDMIYKLTLKGAPFEALCCTNIFANCVVLWVRYFTNLTAMTYLDHR